MCSRPSRGTTSSGQIAVAAPAGSRCGPPAPPKPRLAKSAEEEACPEGSNPRHPRPSPAGGGTTREGVRRTCGGSLGSGDLRRRGKSRTQVCVGSWHKPCPAAHGAPESPTLLPRSCIHTRQYWPVESSNTWDEETTPGRRRGPRAAKNSHAET